MATAIKTKNLEQGAETSIEEVATLAADLGFGGPFTGILKTVLPLLFAALNDPAQVGALLGAPIPEVTVDTERSIDARFGTSGDVPHMS